MVTNISDLASPPNVLAEQKVKFKGFGDFTPPKVLYAVAISKNEVAVAGADAAKLLKLLDAIEELDDVQKVHSNADIDEATLAEAM